jgi:RAQPRD family integrative conjugative element protein
VLIRQLSTLETLVDRAERQARIVADQDDARFAFDYERPRTYL